MKINVLTINGKKITLNILLSNKIIEIKNILYSLENINISEQELIYNNTILDNNNTLEFYNIKNNNNIFLEIKLKGGFIFLTISVIIAVVSVVATIATAAANEARECDKMNGKLKEVTGNFKENIVDLSLYMDDINTNAEIISNYLNKISDELSDLKDTYSDSNKKSKEVFTQVQSFFAVFVIIIIVGFSLKYLRSDKITT